MHPCPRQLEDGVKISSRWREDGTCSYCGSISPETFFTAIERKYELGPTDKNYKVYVDIVDPNAGNLHVVSAITFDITPERQTREGWIKADALVLKHHGWSGDYKWMMIKPRGERMTVKFYFQHLSIEERHRFIELLNSGSLNIGYPGHFYVLPFFATPVLK